MKIIYGTCAFIFFLFISINLLYYVINSTEKIIEYKNANGSKMKHFVKGEAVGVVAFICEITSYITVLSTVLLINYEYMYIAFIIIGVILLIVFLLLIVKRSRKFIFRLWLGRKYSTYIELKKEKNFYSTGRTIGMLMITYTWGLLMYFVFLAIAIIELII